MLFVPAAGSSAIASSRRAKASADHSTSCHFVMFCQSLRFNFVLQLMSTEGKWLLTSSGYLIFVLLQNSSSLLARHDLTLFPVYHHAPSSTTHHNRAFSCALLTTCLPRRRLVPIHSSSAYTQHPPRHCTRPQYKHPLIASSAENTPSWNQQNTVKQIETENSSSHERPTSRPRPPHRPPQRNSARCRRYPTQAIARSRWPTASCPEPCRCRKSFTRLTYHLRDR